MKISKKTVNHFIKCSEQYHGYMMSCISSGFGYDFDNDELHKANWNMYYDDIHKSLGYDVGDMLYSMIEYARKNHLTEENILNALQGMGIEVYE